MEKIEFSDNSTVNSLGDMIIKYAGGDATITTADGNLTLTGVGSGLDDDDFIFSGL